MIYLEEIHQLNTNEELKENGGRTFFLETDDKEVKENAGGSFGNNPVV